MDPCSPFFTDDPYGRFKAGRSDSDPRRTNTAATVELSRGGGGATQPQRSRGYEYRTAPISLPSEQLSHENTSISHMSVDIESRRSMRRRKPPQTQLEVLSSYGTWMVVLFPWVLLSITIPIDYLINNAIPELTVSSGVCASPLKCSFANSSMLIALRQQYYFTQFLEISIKQNYSYTNEMNSKIFSLANNSNNFSSIDIFLYSSSEQGAEPFYHSTATWISSPCLSSYLDDSICDPIDIFSEYFGLDIPTLNANDDLLLLNVTSSSSDPHHDVLQSLEVNLSYSTKAIAIFKAFVECMLFGITVYRIYRSMLQTLRYVDRVAPESQDLIPLTHMLPEQIYCMLLLFFLLLWLNICKALCANFVAYEFYIPDFLFFISGLLQSIGEQGILFSTLLLFDGLRCTTGSAYDVDDDSDADGDGDEISIAQSSREQEVSDIFLNYYPSSSPSVKRRYDAEWLHTQDSDNYNTMSSFQKRTSKTWGPAWVSSESLSLTQGLGQKQRKNYSTVDISESASDFPVHHPYSQFYLDFILLKAIFFVITLLLCFTLWILKYPYVFGIYLDSPNKIKLVQECLAIVEIVLFFCSIFWAIFIFRAMVKSGVKLRKTPYMLSRFRQMGYRLLVSQLSAGIFLLSIIVYSQLYDFVSLMKSYNESFLYTVYYLFTQAITTLQSGVGMNSIIADNSDNYQLGGGMTIYISCICYVVTFIFVPPRLTDLDSPVSKGDHEYAIMERDLSNNVNTQIVREKLKPLQKSNAKSVFCLETALRLMECSWQSYFPPDSDEFQDFLKEDDYFAEVMGYNIKERMDLSNFNLDIESYFHNSQTSTWGFLATNGRKCVITFRGTARKHNVLTDLKMTQEGLPNLKLTGRYFEKLMKSVVSGGSEHYIQESNDWERNSAGSVQFSERSSEDEQIKDDEYNFDKDEIVIHIEKGSCRIVEKHQDCLPDLYYTVVFPDGHELQTPHKNLRKSKDLESSWSETKIPVEENIFIGPISGDHQHDSPRSRKISEAGLPDLEESSDPAEITCLRTILDALPLARETLPRVHAGFWSAYQSVREQVLLAVANAIVKDVKEVLNTPPLIRHVEGSHSLDIAVMLRNSTHIRDIVDCYQLQFCGHSLGGALAVLAALDISINIKKIVRAAIRVSLPADYREDPTSDQGKFMQDRVLQASKLPRVSVYTFGTPKIGNSVFAHLLDDTIGVDEYFRVQVDGDAVVNGFPSIFYSHAGTQVCVDSEATGSIVVNPTIVETHLLGQGSSALRNHSLEVYRRCLEAGFDSEDLREYHKSTYESKKTRKSSQGGRSEGTLDWMSRNRKF